MNLVRLAIACVPAWASTAVVAPPAPGLVYRVRVTDDLECTKAVQELEAAFREAADDEASDIVLELSGNGARLDLVHRAAMALRDARTPVLVWLTGGADDRVGVGQAALAAIAAQTLVAPGVSCSGSARLACEDLRADKVAWDILGDELAGWVRAGLASRGLSSPNGALFSQPPAPVWLEPGGTLSTIRTGAKGEIALTREGSAGPELFITDNSLEGLRVATGRAKDWTAVLRATGHPRARVETRDIQASVEIARRHALDALAAADRLLDQAKDALDLPDPDTHAAAPSRYREAGRRAVRMLAEARRAIDAADDALVEYPEVARTPGPGQGRLERASLYASRWRSGLSAPRKRLEDLEKQAESFRSR